jgi:hypothetical protein
MKTIRTRTARLAWAAVCLAMLSGAARAEDIDIYSYVDANADLPNVLLVLDSSANWSASLPVPNCYYKENGVVTSAGPSSAEQGKKVGIEKCALYNLIDALPVKASGGANNNALFNVGLMIFNESPAANSGGYPRRALLPLTTSSKVFSRPSSGTWTFRPTRPTTPPSPRPCTRRTCTSRASTPTAARRQQVGRGGVHRQPLQLARGEHLRPQLPDLHRQRRPRREHQRRREALLAPSAATRRPLTYPTPCYRTRTRRTGPTSTRASCAAST